MYYLLQPASIVCIYRTGALTTILSAEQGKFFSYECIADLESRLDPNIFFRANRQFLVNINYIKGFTSFERVKLSISLTCEFDQKIIVSQEKAVVFRKWINEEY